MADYPFGKWLPDQPRLLRTPHLREAKNVTPVHNGYGPAKALVPLTGSLGARCRGFRGLRDTAGNVHVYAGTEAALKELASDTTWTDRTRTVGGAYAVGTTGQWRFDSFGDDVIAVNFVDDTQMKDMTTANNFAALAGAPPKAADVCVFGDFVVLGRLGDDYNGIAWSAARDVTGWTPGTNLSDRRSFGDAGFVQRVVGGETLRVFQQRGIRRGDFVGPPNVIDFTRLEVERGLLEANALAVVGRRVYYLAENGFQMIFDGEPIPIGDGMVDRWFFADVNDAFLYRMSATANPVGQIVTFSYASASSSNGTPDTKLNFHVTEQKWTYERIQADPVGSALTQGYTLEGLDAISASIDALGISLDDPLLQGGANRYAAFDADNKLGVFEGAALEAVLETGHFEPVKGRRAMLRSIRPEIGVSTATVSIGKRERTADEPTYTSAASQTATGRVPVRASGRYFDAKITVPAAATWDEADPATGISDIEAQARGKR